MPSIERIRYMPGPNARLGYGIAGAVLVILPALLAYREGIAGLTPGAVAAALFGTGYLVAAALGARRAS